MERRSWTSLRSWRVPLAVLLSMIIGYAIVPVAAVPLAIAGFLYLAARFDNHTGSCLMLAVLVVIAIAILAVLVGFLAVVGRH